MKKITVLLLLSLQLNAMSINELLDSIKKNPSGIEEELKIKKMEASKDSIDANYYPKINLFGSIEQYNTPMNITPLTPTESTSIMLGDKTLPFGRDLQKIGVDIQMMLFSQELNNLHNAMKNLLKASKEQAKLSLLQKEAQVFNANAALAYLESLEKYLSAKRSSLLQTQKRVNAEVNLGRTAPAELFKIENTLRAVEINLSEIRTQKIQQINFINSMTNIALDESIPAKIIKNEIKGDVENSMLAIKYSKEALLEKHKAAKAGYLPKLFLQSTLLRGYGESYYNDKNFDRDYATAALKVTMPIFNKTQNAQMQETKIDYLQEKNRYEKALNELKANEETLQEKLRSLNGSSILMERNVKNSETLLNIAKVSHEIGRMNTEEYLRYEEDLTKAKSDLANIEFQKWQTLSQLVIIYGIDFKKIVE